MKIGRGATSVDINITSVKELSIEDLSEIMIPRGPQSVIKTLRDSHHNVARLVALGLNHTAVAERTGYSYIRVSTLVSDPTFKELVEYYRNLVTKSYVEEADEYMQMATSNMLKAERMIADKLDAADEEGETLTTRELIAISRDAADRFGYHKRQTQVNVNVELAAKLENAIKRSGKTIDGTAVESGRPQGTGPIAHSPAGVVPSQPLRRRIG